MLENATERDAKGRDIIREHLKSILDEAISSTAELDDYGDELEAYANAVMEGLDIDPEVVTEGYVIYSGVLHRKVKK